MPLSSTAPASRPIWPPRCENSGINASPMSAKTPTSTALARVPTPGICRSGIQRSSTRKLTITTTVPMLRPVLAAIPWWNTSHGSRPSPARINIARETPYRARPISSWKSLRVIMGSTSSKLALQTISSLRYWPYVRLPESQLACPSPRRVERGRRARLPRAGRRRPPAGPGRTRRAGCRPAQRAVPGRNARRQPDHRHRGIFAAAGAGLPQQRPGQPRPDLHSASRHPDRRQAAGTAGTVPADTAPGRMRYPRSAGRRAWPFRTASSIWRTRRCRRAAKWCTAPLPPR